MPTLSLLSTALSEEVLGPWDSKFTQEPASTSLEKLLSPVPVFSGRAVAFHLWEEAISNRNPEDCQQMLSPPLSRSCGASQSRNGKHTPLLVSGVKSGFWLWLHKMMGAGWTWPVCGRGSSHNGGTSGLCHSFVGQPACSPWESVVFSKGLAGQILIHTRACPGVLFCTGSQGSGRGKRLKDEEMRRQITLRGGILFIRNETL